MTRKKNPVKARYENLRCSARRRGKEFTLAYDVFCQIVAKAVRLMPGGRTPVSLSIDRIRSREGYTNDNIQVMEYGKNSSVKTKEKCGTLIWGLNCEWKVYTFFIADEVPF